MICRSGDAQAWCDVARVAVPVWGCGSSMLEPVCASDGCDWGVCNFPGCGLK